jgi:N-acylglucosamine 2-epimerase
MNTDLIENYIQIYRDGLLNDVIPFWLKNGLDREQGGVFSALDRDGSVVDTDKAVWIQGRFAWMLSTLYNEVEQRPKWIEAAGSGIEFLRKHCYDTDGRLFFQVTREGKPLRKRRYLFSEAFAVVANAAYAKATGDVEARDEALSLFKNMLHLIRTPGLLEPKVNPETRPMKGLAVPMITIVTAQVLRNTVNDPICNEAIDSAINEIERDFMSEEFEAVLETVGPNGEFIDHFDGRTINPGHAMEAGWFILQESRNRGGDARLQALALRIIDWSWKWGWDQEYGGVTYFKDVRHLPVQEYWHDMKFWWPQNETIIATLMAYVVTGNEEYAQWHQLVHDWAYKHYPDPQFGEWFGYLHRDGRIASHAKGTMWKGPFHLPRMQLVCWQLLEEMKVAR